MRFSTWFRVLYRFIYVKTVEMNGLIGFLVLMTAEQFQYVSLFPLSERLRHPHNKRVSKICRPMTKRMFLAHSLTPPLRVRHPFCLCSYLHSVNSVLPLISYESNCRRSGQKDWHDRPRGRNAFRGWNIQDDAVHHAQNIQDSQVISFRYMSPCSSTVVFSWLACCNPPRQCTFDLGTL